MYLPFFGLNEKPFSITPDPRYLYLSERHAEALAHLVYGVSEAGGFVQLTGEVGTGKTTVIRSLLGQVPKNAEVALILNPRMSAPEFLLTICEELGIGVPDSAEGSIKDLVDILSRYLLRAHAEGRRVVLVVDEAQNLAIDVLEQVRLLTNLETPTQKLLQIILIGQPELRELLGRPELRQLAQRITGRYHLDPLSEPESAAYVRHRLRVAGATSDIFTNGALAEVHRLSGGVPRLINVISDRALLGAYTQDRHRVTGVLVRRAATEVLGQRFTPPWLPWVAGGAVAAALALGSFGVWRFGLADGVIASPAPAPASASAPAPGAPLTAEAARADATPGAPHGAAPEAAPAPPVPLTTSDVLTRHAAETTTEGAYARLFRLWGATYTPGGGDPCLQAVRQGYDCLAQRGTLAQLRLYNRPAVLTLNDSTGGAYQVVVSRLGATEAWLELGDSPPSVGIADLANYWFGDYVILWRPATPGVKDLSAGMRGPEVAWLREGLERLAGVERDEPASDLFDRELARLVEQFQRERRLTVDGIAGVQTQVALDAALPPPGTPVLSDMPRGG
jgi:general secretion pathway protein A